MRLSILATQKEVGSGSLDPGPSRRFGKTNRVVDLELCPPPVNGLAEIIVLGVKNKYIYI